MNAYLLSLLQLSDPALPVGGYAHSAGLETYVQKGIVFNKPTALEFVIQMLSRNLLFTDGAFVSFAYDAAREENYAAIIQYDEECTAVKLAKETRVASQKLGIRLIKIFEPLCSSRASTHYKKAVASKEAMGHYCIAFGLYAQALVIPKREALFGFYYNMAAGMVTNCVKLVPLGQQDGQQMLFSLHVIIQQLVEQSVGPDKAFVGLCCTGFDIRCMQHEQLYSRLYMS